MFVKNSSFKINIEKCYANLIVASRFRRPGMCGKWCLPQKYLGFELHVLSKGWRNKFAFKLSNRQSDHQPTLHWLTSKPLSSLHDVPTYTFLNLRLIYLSTAIWDRNFRFIHPRLFLHKLQFALRRWESTKVYSQTECAKKCLVDDLPSNGYF